MIRVPTVNIYDNSIKKKAVKVREDGSAKLYH